MRKLFVATNNAHKIEEIDLILKEANIDCELFYPKKMGVSIEPIEDGDSFEANALIKARFYHEMFKMDTIADDSGICIAFLDNKPGVHSSRFLPEMNYDEKNKYICNLLKDSDNRDAHYVSVIAYVTDEKEMTFEGVFEGKIAYEPKGQNGFGYDPIFYLSEYDKTVGEIDASIKNKISHRYKALRKWLDAYK